MQSILKSKMRAFLTMLGIIIGVSAVTVIVGMGNGMESYISDSFESMGTNLINVNIQGRGTSRSGISSSSRRQTRKARAWFLRASMVETKST